jgi:hypothetical protein
MNSTFLLRAFAPSREPRLFFAREGAKVAKSQKTEL